VTFAPTAPEGFLVRSYANDDFGACRDHVRDRLRLQRPPRERKSETVSLLRHATGIGGEISPPIDPDPERQAKTRLAVTIWRESVDPRGTLVERYFRVHRQGLDLPHELCGRVLRFNSACPWRDGEAGRTIRVPAMVAAMRDIHSNELRAVHRTRLDEDGLKVDAAGSATRSDASSSSIPTKQYRQGSPSARALRPARPRASSASALVGQRVA
jgi:putative DNA primase/helicase